MTAWRRWARTGDGRGPKMDVAANKSKDDTKTAVKQKNTHYVQDEAVTVYGV